MPLFDIGLADTAYPFLLFLSQAETESVLSEQLAGRGVLVERGTEVVRLERTGSSVACRLRSGDGGEETVDARYVVGCDGAHSTVRDQAGIGFEGRSRRWPRRRRSCGPRPRGRWSRSSRTGPRGCGSVRFGVTVTGVARAGRDRIVDADPSRSASLPRSRPAATELRTRARRFFMSRVQLALRVPDLDASLTSTRP
ncbi:FAD-dependent monooxygenase [Streptomyces sp. NBC_01589]